mmetsp:Transcript_34637/g.52975  ORF Transcript_34637/g.52975 Transcript_34637/m.52975 type:complete len:144 (+) Transcript_34637:127-558(+)
MYSAAEDVYRQILTMEKSKVNEQERNVRNCIDALNSIGYCIKFRVLLQDLLEDREAEGVKIVKEILTDNPDAKTDTDIGVFSYLVKVYSKALSFDPHDVEANFNLAGIYLQRNELDNALKHYLESVKKDAIEGLQEVRDLFVF